MTGNQDARSDTSRTASAAGSSEDLQASRVIPELTAMVPPGWSWKESVTINAPDGQANLIFSSEDASEYASTVEYAETQGTLLRREFSGYTEFAFERYPAFGRSDGMLRAFEWLPEGGQSVIRQSQAYLVEDGRGYTATITGPREGFNVHEAVLISILNSLRSRVARFVAESGPATP